MLGKSEPKILSQMVVGFMVMNPMAVESVKNHLNTNPRHTIDGRDPAITTWDGAKTL